MPPTNNKKRQRVFRRFGFALSNFGTTVYYKIRKNNPRKFCRTQSKNFHAKVWKVSLENTTTWKIKSSTSYLDLCAPTKIAQTSVLVASQTKQKSSMTYGVHQNSATGKNMKRYEPVKNACVTKFR